MSGANAGRPVYANYSGVGNTFNANHPLPLNFIVDCLRYWVEEVHVDGFRFDEGSILARGEDGTPLVHPPVIWQIEFEDALANTFVPAVLDGQDRGVCELALQHRTFASGTRIVQCTGDEQRRPVETLPVAGPLLELEGEVVK